MTMVWFGIAAVSGALVRHAVNLRGRGWLGTLAVNLCGALVLGYLLGRGVSDDVALVVGTAGCGSVTTFSMFALEAVEARGAARVVIVGSTISGSLAAAVLGYALG